MKKYKKHFLIYYHAGSESYITAEPHSWAHGNQGLFPKYSFIDKSSKNHPVVAVIEKLLIQNYAFKKCVEEDTIVLYNFDTKITFK